jgi:hypothetical protein
MRNAIKLVWEYNIKYSDPGSMIGTSRIRNNVLTYNLIQIRDSPRSCGATTGGPWTIARITPVKPGIPGRVLKNHGFFKKKPAQWVFYFFFNRIEGVLGFFQYQEHF